MDFLKPIASNPVNFDSPNRSAIEQNVIKGNSDALLGRGAYGVVIRAIYKKRNVAVKIIEKLSSFKFNSLKRESNSLLLDHKNIIRALKIVDDCEDYGAVIMERFNGQTLQAVLNTCRIDLLHRLHILSDIASALSYCHSKQIIHCDVKPQNIFVALGSNLDERGYVCKLFDFGCSVIANDLDPCEPICGTFLYSAPEVLQNLKPKSSVDIFSLAIIMWQIKENRIPYESIRDVETIIWKVVKDNLRPDTCSIADNKNLFLNVKLGSPYGQNVPSPHVKSLSGNGRILPRVLIDKPSSLQKLRIYRKKVLQGKKLFESTHKSEIENCLFIDHRERSTERVSHVEAEFTKLYRTCWSEDESLRLSAATVHDKLQHFMQLL